MGCRLLSGRGQMGERLRKMKGLLEKDFSAFSLWKLCWLRTRNPDLGKFATTIFNLREKATNYLLHLYHKDVRGKLHIAICLFYGSCSKPILLQHSFSFLGIEFFKPEITELIEHEVLPLNSL